MFHVEHRYCPVRYVGSLPEYQGRVGCLEPDPASSDRSVIYLWGGFGREAVRLSNVRRESIDGAVCVDPSMTVCPCGRHDPSAY